MNRITMVQTDPTKRFSNRVEYYVKYRPHYPHAIVNLMCWEMGLTSDSLIADVGAGTGFLSELFLTHKNLIFAVEPNREMRAAAEVAFGHHPMFRSIDGTAENTTLVDHSVDFITAGQAFHWFDADRAKVEFVRILKPGGQALFTWNWRDTNSTPFARAYEAFCQEISEEYKQLKDLAAIESSLKAFFSPHGCQRRSFRNAQMLDFEGFKGRVLSSSYTPMPGHPKYEGMIAELRCLFDRYHVEGRIRIDYDTRVYYGRLGSSGIFST